MTSDQEPQAIDYPEGDVDAGGQFALALFVGGLVVLLLVIYAFAQAA